MVSPQKVTYNLGNGKNYFEIGLGGMLVFGNTSDTYTAYPTVGYRFLGKNKSSFKLYVSWLFNGVDANELAFFPLGLSIGQLW